MFFPLMNEEIYVDLECSSLYQQKNNTILRIYIDWYICKEAEAILDDIKPTPALVISYGLVRITN